MLAQEGILNINDYKLLLICESCLLRKMTKSLFTEKDERASEVLGLIHSDVCGSMNISVRGGYSYFITIIDDLSRYGCVYLMKYKSKSFEIFNWFHNEVEKQIEKNIKIFRSDRGGKYLSNEFLAYVLIGLHTSVCIRPSTSLARFSFSVKSDLVIFPSKQDSQVGNDS